MSRAAIMPTCSAVYIPSGCLIAGCLIATGNYTLYRYGSSGMPANRYGIAHASCQGLLHAKWQ